MIKLNRQKEKKYGERKKEKGLQWTNEKKRGQSLVLFSNEQLVSAFLR